MEIKKRDDVKIFMLCHKPVEYGFIDDSVITPLECGADYSDLNACKVKDNTGVNISIMNQFFTEDTGIYWIWKNVKGCKYKGQMQYRRRLHGIGEETDFDAIFKKDNAIIAESMDMRDWYGIEGFTVENQYAMAHSIKDLRLMEDIIRDRYPDYYPTYVECIKEGSRLIYSNGFILKSEDYDEYCELLFGVLYEWLQRMGFSRMSQIEEYVRKSILNGDISCAGNNMFNRDDLESCIKYQMRIGGSLAERLFTVYARRKFHSVHWVPYDKEENIKM